MRTKLLLLLLLANFSIYAQTNLVPNGGFESWTGSVLQNWTVSNSVIKSTDFVEGQSSVKLTNGGLNPKITALVPLKAGITYTIKYKYKYLGTNYNNDPVVLKIWQDGSATNTTSTTYASTNNWTEKEITFTPDSNLSYELSISTFNPDSITFEILIDDVFVVDPNEGVAQYTLIADSNFEQKLIDLKIDTDGINGKVLTSSINTVTALYLNKSSIQDLSGIEDFVNLETLVCNGNNITTLDLSNNTKLSYLNANANKLVSLNVTKNVLLTDLSCSGNKLSSLNIDNNTALKDLRCGGNLLTNLNVSKNTHLVYLICNDNEIGSLDVSQNISLEWLMFHYNKVKTIDISHNPELTYFDCLFNELTRIDISKNPKIFEVACENNQLTYLNLKNGNNVNFDLFYSNFKNNPNLTCIVVDDVDYSNSKWAGLKDVNASYSSSCALGIEDSVFAKATIYPNPTNGEVNISNIALDKATVFNSLGQLVKTFSLDSNNTNNTINLSGLPKGVYYIYLINQDAASAKKVIVE
jgi:hypothetical protein